DDLVVASLVGQLAGLGLEPRHLRGFRSAADRELGLLDQVIPPAARQQSGAAAELAELAALAVRLHTVLVRAGLRSRTEARCANSRSSESGSRCPRTSHWCCCVSSRARGTCPSGSVR